MRAVGGWLILVGSLVFLGGAAYGMPRVFMLRDPGERRSLLTAHEATWRRAQWLYAAGPLLAALGVLVVARGWTGRPAVFAWSAGAALLLGALLWSLVCARRGRHIDEFARGTLPVPPWLGYVWLTVLGLALLGIGCLAASLWVALLLLVAAGAFAILFVVARDIPPFVFYLVLLAVGIWAAAGT